MSPKRRKAMNLVIGRPVSNMRVTIYLLTMSWWGVLNGLSYYLTSERLSRNETFSVVNDILTVKGWGLVLMFYGTMALVNATLPYERSLRIFLVFSVFIKVSFGVALLFAWTWSPGFTSYIALAVVDMIVIRSKYKSPEILRG